MAELTLEVEVKTHSVRCFTHQPDAQGAKSFTLNALLGDSADLLRESLRRSGQATVLRRQRNFERIDSADIGRERQDGYGICGLIVRFVAYDKYRTALNDLRAGNGAQIREIDSSSLAGAPA